MKKAHLVLALPICLSAWAAVFAQVQNANKAVDLLNQSYSASGNIKDSEQLYYLTDLARVSAAMSPHPPQTELWCRSLFVAASQVQDPLLRAAGQKNALMYLSSVDPVLALRRLDDVQVLKGQGGAIQDEDVRADAADTIFSNLWERFGAKAIPDIERTAASLGASGQYPYRAAAAILKRLSPASDDQSRTAANTLFRDAFESYRRENGFQNREEEFLNLLRSAGLSMVDSSLVDSALKLYVDRLAEQTALSHVHYYAEVYTSQGSIVPFSDRNRAFLFMLMPVIRQFEFEKDFADKLIEQYPELKDASGEMHYVSGGFFFGNPSDANRQHIQWLQQSLLSQIKTLQDSAPEIALQMASRLTDRTMRIVGYSTVLPSLAKTNRSAALQLYADQVAQAQNLSDPSERLTATVALAEAAHYLGETADRSKFINESFKLALNMFNHDSRPVRTQKRKGYSELAQVASLAAESGSDSIVDQIQRIQSPRLKGHLLIAAAEGSAKQNGSSNVTTAKK